MVTSVAADEGIKLDDDAAVAIAQVSLGDLRKAITVEGIRKIDAWTERYLVSHVDFTVKGFDPFFNINTKENLIEAEKILKDYEND